MDALVIAHDHVSPTGPVGDALSDHGYAVTVHDVVPEDRHHAPGVVTRFPDFTAYDLVVPMGAPWSAYDRAVASWVEPELDQLRAADGAGVPVLGICFGGQLLATAHGGTVTPAAQAEIGWVEVASLAPEVIPAGPWFEWHYDGWTLPPGATELARNASASQAFRLRRNLAVQFHPELTPAMLEGWLANGGEAKAVAHGLDPAELLATTRAMEARSRARARGLVDGFLAHVATAA